MKTHYEVLNRVEKYLRKYPTTANTFSVQSMFNRIRVYVDTDHAGCAVKRRNSAGLCAVLGRHIVKHGSSVQLTFSLSSVVSE